MPNADTTKRISVGDAAPDFELFSHENEAWRLSDHLDRPVVLLFFPGAFTSVCTTELTTVSDDLESFKDAHVVGISTDSTAVLSKYRSEYGFEFPLLSDHSAEVSQLYGAKYDENFGPMDLDRISKRAVFVVDREGIVHYAQVLEDASNEPDYTGIKEALRTISKEDEGGSLRPMG